MGKNVLFFAFFITALNLPSLSFADGVFSVSALGLNISRDVSQEKHESANKSKNASSTSAARFSNSRKASGVAPAPARLPKKEESPPVVKRKKQREEGIGALGFRKPKKEKEHNQSLVGSTKVKVEGTAAESLNQQGATEKIEADSANVLLLSDEKPLDSVAEKNSVKALNEGEDVLVVSSEETAFFTNSFQNVAKSIFAINRRKEPQFISKALAFSTGSTESLSKLSYSWYFGNMYAAVSYRSVSVSDDIFTMISGELRSNEMTKLDEQVRVYPMNWLARFSRLQMSYGLFYSRRNFLQNEVGSGGDVRFDNEITLAAEQYGLQTSFLYRTRSFRFRGFVHIPVTLLSVDESYYYDDGDSISSKKSSVSSVANVAYELSVEMIMKTQWGFSLLASGAYEALPLEYKKIRVLQNIDDQFEFSLVDYKAENRDINLSFSVLFDSLNIVNISPYVAINFNRDTRFDRTKSTSLTIDSVDMLLGFSSQF